MGGSAHGARARSRDAQPSRPIRACTRRIAFLDRGCGPAHPEVLRLRNIRVGARSVSYARSVPASTDHDAALEFMRVSKTFSGTPPVHALTDVSLSVRSGEI